MYIPLATPCFQIYPKDTTHKYVHLSKTLSAEYASEMKITCIFER